MEDGHFIYSFSMKSRHIQGFCTRYSSWPPVGVVMAWKNGILPSLIFKSGANAQRGVLQGLVIGL